MSSKIKILAYWPAADWDEFFKPAFSDNDKFQVDIVNGDRTSITSEYAMTLGRLFEIRKKIKTGHYDLIISGNIWHTPWPKNKGLATRCSNAFRYITYKRKMLDTWWATMLHREVRQKIPFAVVDLRDPFFVLPADEALLKLCTTYFKRELFWWKRRSLLPLSMYHGKNKIFAHEHKLEPLSYGIDPQKIPQSVESFERRDIDVFISGTNNPVRESIKEKVKALSKKYKVIVADFLSAEDYQRALKTSKIVVCTESWGCETWRQYEASAYGAVPMINWPYVTHHEAFQPDTHAIYFSLIANDFEKQLEFYLSRPELLKMISESSREHTIKTKSRKAIGEYIVSRSMELF